MHPKKPQSPAEAPVAQSDRATVSATVASDAATVRGSARPIVSLPKSREELRAEREALKAETLEQWAARVAPTLDADGWADARDKVRVADGMARPLHAPVPAVAALTVAQCRALLAYRDSVAAGLKPNTAAVLRWSCRPGGCMPEMHASLERLSLVVADIDADTMHATDFGREIARVLGGAQ